MHGAEADDVEAEPQWHHATPVSPPTALEKEVARTFLEDADSNQGHQARTDAADLGGQR